VNECINGFAFLLGEGEPPRLELLIKYIEIKSLMKPIGAQKITIGKKQVPNEVDWRQKKKN